MYKFSIFAPRDEKLIRKLIEVASQAGAGNVGNYTHCAFITEGHTTWVPQEGSNPTEGEVCEFTKNPEVKIEMECPKDKIQAVLEAVKKVHPYEKITFDAVSIDRFE